VTTVRQYFDTDFSQYLAIHADLQLLPEGAAGENPQIFAIAKLLLDIDANVKFGAYFVPTCKEAFDVCINLVQHPEWVLAVDEGTRIESGLSGYGEGGLTLCSSEVVFSGRIFLYCENQLSESQIQACQREGTQRGLTLYYRGPRYAEVRATHEHPLAFISHDHRDKDEIARPLALDLMALSCPVWFDEFSLRVGASLRESVERGLKEARKCILLVTPHFLGNDGWGKREFDSVFTRELLEKENIILPVWHEVTPQEVYEYSPSLANKVALKWSEGGKAVAGKLRQAVLTPSS
jgi:hypothetical protein